MRFASMTLIVAALSAGVACARQHMTSSQGQSYEAAFRAQRAPPAPIPAAAASRPSTAGLDSQEAEIVADSYRRSLAPKDMKVNEEPIIIVPSQTQGGGYQRTPALPPSVPK